MHDIRKNRLDLHKHTKQYDYPEQLLFHRKGKKELLTSAQVVVEPQHTAC